MDSGGLLISWPLLAYVCLLRGKTVQTLDQASKSLGMTPRQLRRRLEATAPLLAPYVRRGDKNRLLLDHSAVEILRAVEDRRANGYPLKEAIGWVAESMRGGQGGNHREDEGQTGGIMLGGNGQGTNLLVEELRDRIRFLEEENRRIWSLVSDLKDQLALPPARVRRGLFGWLRRSAN